MLWLPLDERKSIGGKFRADIVVIAGDPVRREGLFLIADIGNICKAETDGLIRSFFAFKGDHLCGHALKCGTDCKASGLAGFVNVRKRGDKAAAALVYI